MLISWSLNITYTISKLVERWWTPPHYSLQWTCTFMKCIEQNSGHVTLTELSSLWAVELVRLVELVYSIVQKKLSSWGADTLCMRWEYPRYYLQTSFTLLCNCAALTVGLPTIILTNFVQTSLNYPVLQWQYHIMCVNVTYSYSKESAAFCISYRPSIMRYSLLFVHMFIRG